MKKSFLTLVALFAVTLSALTFTSCSKDDDDTDSKTTRMTTYNYSLTLTDNFFSLYDVTVTATYGDSTKTFTFKDATTLHSYNTFKDYAATQTAANPISVKNGTNVTFTCKLALKSDWKETLEKLDDEIVFIFLRNYNGGSVQQELITYRGDASAEGNLKELGDDVAEQINKF